MSSKTDFLAIRPRKQHCLPNPPSSQRACSSTWSSRHRRICSSPSLPTYYWSSRDDFDNDEHLDLLNEITLDSALDQRSASSATLLSPRSSPSSSTNLIDDTRISSEPESRQSLSLHPQREPGQMTAQRIQRLRSRTASVILSIPATSEDVIDTDEDEEELREVVATLPATQTSKLRRVPGVSDLRRAFRDGERGPVHFAPTSSFAHAKASYELGILVTPAPPSSRSRLSLRSSLRTLVEMGNVRPQSSGDLKTLCESTLSSASIASRFTAKVQSAFPPPLSLSSPYTLPTNASQPEFPRKYHIHNPSTPHRRVPLHQNTRQSVSPGDGVWSCAKISRSAIKLAARRGNPPRRVFSNPTAG